MNMNEITMMNKVVLDPRDPNQVGITTLNTFICNYMETFADKEMREKVIPNTIMCSAAGKSIYTTTQGNLDRSGNSVLSYNLRSIGLVLLMYNMNLSALRFSVRGGSQPPCLFLDPDVVNGLMQDRFMKDRTFLSRIKYGIGLVDDRRIVLVRGNITRTRTMRRFNQT